jgi:ribosomal protein S18 acetylase RimI-like enzyme
MSKIVLNKMNVEESNRFFDETIHDLAEANVICGDWQENESLEKSKEHFEKQFPDGIINENNYLYSILNQKYEIVGKIWMTVSKNKIAWLQNIKIGKKFRRNGYGKAAVEVLTKIAKDSGIIKIGLHVFGYNKEALQFYSSLGFTTKNVRLEKNLNDNGKSI